MNKQEKPKTTITLSDKAIELKKKFKSHGINFSFHVEKLVFDIAKKHKIK